MSEQPTACRIVAPDVAIHWFPSYVEGIPCFCGAATCHVEEDEDDEAIGYEIEDATSAPGEPGDGAEGEGEDA